jgi:hypothetical protein
MPNMKHVWGCCAKPCATRLLMPASLHQCIMSAIIPDFYVVPLAAPMRLLSP